MKYATLAWASRGEHGERRTAVSSRPHPGKRLKRAMKRALVAARKRKAAKEVG